MRNALESNPYAVCDQRHFTRLAIKCRARIQIGNRQYFKLKVRVKADLMRGWLLYVVPWEVSTRWRETRVRRADETS